jgi:hypothetical protein
MFTFFDAPTIKTASPSLQLAGPACTACNLIASCKHGKQRTPRTGKHVIVVDAPGSDSPNGLYDQKGLYGALKSVGRDLGDYVVVPASACPGEYNGKVPSWEHCQPLLIEQIDRLKPETIILYGKQALNSVVRWLWGTAAELPDRWYGNAIPSRQLNAWILPVGKAGLMKNAEVSQIFHYRWMQRAVRFQGRPYDQVPEYKVEILDNEAEIIRRLKEASNSRLSGFDYETNSLKPERARAKIYTASVAWLDGTSTPCIAFNMTPGIRSAWIEYLQSPSKKIAANMKFEMRWTRTIFGIEVANLIWDTMINAHLQDPQETVTGLKWQAFARLGLGYYAGDVEKHFENADEQGYNNIHLADTGALLLYNGIDALAELDLAVLQMYEAGRYEHLWTDNLPKKSYFQFGELL